MRISKYAPLCDHLKESKEQFVTLTFQEIEKIIGSDLPPSAREHDAWWDNSHTQAKSGWLAAGYNASVDLNNETATFVKITDNKPRENKSASVIYWDAPFELLREPWSIATSVEDEEDENEGIYNDAIKIFEPAYTAADIEGLAKALTKFESIKKYFPDAHGYIDNIKQCIYETAKEKMKSAKTVDEWSKLADVFNKIPNFCQSNDLQRQCSDNAKYSKGVNIFNSANEKKDIDKLVEALEIFKYIQNYPDVQKYIEQIKKSIYETAEEKKNVAKTEYDFKAVANIFDKIKGFNEADSLKQQCLGEAERAKKKAIYDKAQNIFESADKKDVDELVESLELFESIKDFPGAQGYIDRIKQCIYEQAKEQRNLKNWKKAAKMFGHIKKYQDAKECLNNFSLIIINNVRSRDVCNIIKLLNFGRLPTIDELKWICKQKGSGIPDGVYWALSERYDVEKARGFRESTFFISSELKVVFERDVVRFPDGELFKSNSDRPRGLLLVKKDIVTDLERKLCLNVSELKDLFGEDLLEDLDLEDLLF